MMPLPTYHLARHETDHLQPAQTRRALRWEGITGSLPARAPESWLRRAWTRLARPAPIAPAAPPAPPRVAPPAPETPARTGSAAPAPPRPALAGVRAILSPAPAALAAAALPVETDTTGVEPVVPPDDEPFEMPAPEPLEFHLRP